MHKHFFLALFICFAVFRSETFAKPEEYKIDTSGAHAFINFRIKHLGYSWLLGHFDDFSGEFTYDKEEPSQAMINLTIDVASVDTNHAKRDKHLRSQDFLDVAAFPEAKFSTVSFEEIGNKKAILKGKLTLHGVTKLITIDIEHIGHGPDPWGGYRRGFIGTTHFKPSDFGINLESLGAASQKVFLELAIEGLRKNSRKKGKN